MIHVDKGIGKLDYGISPNTWPIQNKHLPVSQGVLPVRD